MQINPNGSVLQRFCAHRTYDNTETTLVHIQEDQHSLGTLVSADGRARPNQLTMLQCLGAGVHHISPTAKAVVWLIV